MPASLSGPGQNLEISPASLLDYLKPSPLVNPAGSIFKTRSKYTQDLTTAHRAIVTALGRASISRGITAITSPPVPSRLLCPLQSPRHARGNPVRTRSDAFAPLRKTPQQHLSHWTMALHDAALGLPQHPSQPRKALQHTGHPATETAHVTYMCEAFLPPVIPTIPYLMSLRSLSKCHLRGLPI